MRNLQLQISLMLMLILAYPLQIAHAQASATASEMLNAQGIETLILDLGTDSVVVRYIKGSRIVVESRVTIGTPNDRLMQYLVDNGRYTITSSIDAASNSITIARKKNNNILLVKGQECTEDFFYILLIPENIKFIKKSGSTL